MARIRHMSALAVLAALCFSASLAYAQAGASHRVWVSGHGSDSPGCGAPTLPCRSFQYVVDNVIAPGGEIDVLDPAGFGAVTVPFALSIVNDGVGEAGVQAVSGNAITITAGATDVVNLRGLTLAGNGAAFDVILFNTGSRLNV